jgi:hypothetical protein
MTRDSQYPKGVTRMLDLILALIAGLISWN